jgi:hypothetical protein
MREAWISMSVAVALLAGCSEPAPPPHGLDDATTAAQRASAAMQTTSNLPIEKNIATKPADGGVQTDKTEKTQ